MMISFYKKSVHSFFNLPSSTHPITLKPSPSPSPSSPPPPPPPPPSTCQCLSTLTGGLGLITATGDMLRRPNVVESASVKSTPPSSPAKKDPGGIGFIDDIGGEVDGLMSCTESLGFESSDERRVDDQIEEMNTTYDDPLCMKVTSIVRKKWRKMGERREVKKYPPPISSLNQNGQPSFFMRSVRKDGRLELTEVRINRPEILRASRQDGRLRLHLIRDDDIEEDCIQEEEEEQEQEQEVELEQERKDDQVQEKVIEEDKEEEEEVRVGERKFPVSEEGFRRCHELVNHHHHHHYHRSNHHHNLHVWSQHCVTIR